MTTDTVGTKVLVADALGRWEEVGEDIVGVNVNDLAAVGARPAGLVDTILCAAPDPRRFAAIGRGLARGLRSARCALLGGETAVVPEIVRGIDLGGTAVGFFPRGRRPILGDRLRPNDIILGLRSTGLHANGFTLVRRWLAEERLPLDRPRPGARRPLGEELLRPTRIYVRAIDAIADEPGVHGLAHISGGGVRNLVRLNRRVRFRLDQWPAPDGLFAFIAERGGISLREMYQTFNMGIGFVVIVAPSAAASIAERLERAGAGPVVRLGSLAPGHGVELPHLGLLYDEYGGA